MPYIYVLNEALFILKIDRGSNCITSVLHWWFFLKITDTCYKTKHAGLLQYKIQRRNGSRIQCDLFHQHKLSIYCDEVDQTYELKATEVRIPVINSCCWRSGPQSTFLLLHAQAIRRLMKLRYVRNIIIYRHQKLPPWYECQLAVLPRYSRHKFQGCSLQIEMSFNADWLSRWRTYLSSCNIINQLASNEHSSLTLVYPVGQY